MVNIMIVEDEKPISNLIALSLKKVGYHCECAYDGLSAIDMIEKKYPDLILLDIMLPGADGFEILEYVKPLDIPVIFLTAKGELSDKVNGLRLGAEDYIVKPFEMLEVMVRLELKDGVYINLTKKEYDILLLFARNPGSVLFREMIYDRVWGGDYIPGSRTVDLHVQRVRKKVGWENYLISVPKMGYRLEVAK